MYELEDSPTYNADGNTTLRLMDIPLCADSDETMESDESPKKIVDLRERLSRPANSVKQAPCRNTRSRSRTRQHLKQAPRRNTRSRSGTRQHLRNRSRDRSQTNHIRNRSREVDRFRNRSRSRSSDRARADLLRNRSPNHRLSDRSRNRSSDRSRNRSRDRSRNRSRDRSRNRSRDRSRNRSRSDHNRAGLSREAAEVQKNEELIARLLRETEKLKTSMEQKKGQLRSDDGRSKLTLTSQPKDRSNSRLPTDAKESSSSTSSKVNDSRTATSSQHSSSSKMAAVTSRHSNATSTTHDSKTSSTSRDNKTSSTDKSSSDKRDSENKYRSTDSKTSSSSNKPVTSSSNKDKVTGDFKPEVNRRESNAILSSSQGSGTKSDQNRITTYERNRDSKTESTSRDNKSSSTFQRPKMTVTSSSHDLVPTSSSRDTSLTSSSAKSAPIRNDSRSIHSSHDSKSSASLRDAKDFVKTLDSKSASSSNTALVRNDINSSSRDTSLTSSSAKSAPVRNDSRSMHSSHDSKNSDSLRDAKDVVKILDSKSVSSSNTKISLDYSKVSSDKSKEVSSSRSSKDTVPHSSSSARLTNTARDSKAVSSRESRPESSLDLKSAHLSRGVSVKPSSSTDVKILARDLTVVLNKSETARDQTSSVARSNNATPGSSGGEFNTGVASTRGSNATSVANNNNNSQLSSERVSTDTPQQQLLMSSTVCFGPIGRDCLESDLNRVFRRYGIIRDCTIVKDKAFLIYETVEEAQVAASSIDGSIFMGNKIHVMPIHEAMEHVSASLQQTAGQQTNSASLQQTAGQQTNSKLSSSHELPLYIDLEDRQSHAGLHPTSAASISEHTEIDKGKKSYTGLNHPVRSVALEEMLHHSTALVLQTSKTFNEFKNNSDRTSQPLVDRDRTSQPFVDRDHTSQPFVDRDRTSQSFVDRDHTSQPLERADTRDRECVSPFTMPEDLDFPETFVRLPEKVAALDLVGRNLVEQVAPPKRIQNMMMEVAELSAQTSKLLDRHGRYASPKIDVGKGELSKENVLMSSPQAQRLLSLHAQRTCTQPSGSHSCPRSRSPVSHTRQLSPYWSQSQNQRHFPPSNSQQLSPPQSPPPLLKRARLDDTSPGVHGGGLGGRSRSNSGSSETSFDLTWPGSPKPLTSVVLCKQGGAVSPATRMFTSKNVWRRDVKSGLKHCKDVGRRPTGTGKNGQVLSRARLDLRRRLCSTNINTDSGTDWGERTLETFLPRKSLGQGKYGQLYTTAERKSGLVVVLKAALEEVKKDGGVSVCTLQELKLMAQLKHDNIVCLIDVIRDGYSGLENEYFLMYEYVPLSLREAVKTKCLKLAVDDITIITKQILQGLRYCHALDIVHGDLKPSNILIGDRLHIKIAQFGLAQIFDKKGRRTSKEISSSLWYQAPEILLGEKKYGAAVDLWSCGCILGEMLLQRTTALFCGTDEVDQLLMISTVCGTPSVQTWPDVVHLPHYHTVRAQEYRPRKLRERFATVRSDPVIVDVLDELLTYNPKGRKTAASALASDWLKNSRCLKLLALKEDHTTSVTSSTDAQPTARDIGKNGGDKKGGHVSNPIIVSDILGLDIQTPEILSTCAVPGFICMFTSDESKSSSSSPELLIVYGTGMNRVGQESKSR